MVIFKRKTMLKEMLPDGVVVHCHSKGWMDRGGMAVWSEKVWCPRPVSFDKTSLLIFDSLVDILTKVFTTLSKLNTKQLQL